MGDVATRDPGGLELLAELEKAGAITPTSLDLDPETPFPRWEALGALLGHVHRSACFLIGDWLNFGERVYGETYAQASDIGLSESTLQNYASVARKVPPLRRRATLPYSSHALVAALEPAEQDRWLAQAEAEGWSRRELKAAMDGDTTEVERHNCPDCGREHVVQT